jgi:prepilin-type N-terminal cleavage/methylation domain-containing protein
MQTRKNRKTGFTLVEIMIVVAIIGLLAAIAIPNFVKARTSSQTSACIANLKQIQGAIATWAMEAKKFNSSSVVTAQIFGANNYIRVKPACPAGGTYGITTVQANPTCTIAGHTLPN